MDIKIDSPKFNEILSDISTINKKLIIEKKSINDVIKDDLYVAAVTMREQISNHAVKGKFPDKLFKHRSPNETEAESNYIKNNYKQVTLPIFVDYLNTITRCFGDGNWSIEYAEDANAYKTANQTFEDYVSKELPIYGSLENFIKFILPTIKSIDANGYIAIRPKDISYIELEDGTLKVSDTELLKPTLFYHSSERVIDVDEDYALFLSAEKSKVTFGGKQVEEGNIYELYTKESIFIIKQVGNKIDNRFEYTEFLRHDLGYLPIHQLMGIPNIQDDEILWQSPFLYAVDLLDIVTINANWLQASINSCVYPVKVMYGQPCEFQQSNGDVISTCQDGYLIGTDGSKRTCPSCNGSGLKNRLSPLGTLLLNPKGTITEGDTGFSQKPLEYVSPSTETLKFLSDKIEIDTEKARKILHLQTSNSQVKGSENLTATGTAIDAKSMQAFVKPISDQIFTIYEFCLKAIGEMRYAEFEAPKLSYPKSFDFKTPEDYLIDISNALKTNLPPSFVTVVLMQYIRSYYGDTSVTTDIFRLIMSADRLFGLSQDEINMQLARGTVAKWESVLHTSAIIFVDKLINEDENFLSKDLQVQIETLQQKAKDVQEENTPIAANIVNTLTP